MSKKNLNKHLIGLTGEYFVAGMMSLKGWVASLTLKNYPSVDIFGLNPETDKTVNIQVKTTRKHTSFNIGLRHDQRNIIRDKILCPFVFVHIDKNDHVRYFILSRKEFIDLIEKTDDAYFNKPRTKPIKPNYPIAIKVTDLQIFEDKWDNIWKK
ncbi:hypothetical protein [Winogradskyella vincentii]|uniref:DUF4365 domain-containing protein n=1 Tax=Winogradskyella vincentii TaxID=2877122 RepID=A0ABS7Y5A3_9FLAO|nr:hypothetical protein [Winogradskyella vincentii]MCA0154520.1 hypothetical protein [Winogradskyella vincentii]